MRRHGRAVAALGTALLLAASSIGTATTASATDDPDRSSRKIEPRLLAELGEPGADAYFIDFKAEADLGAAARIRDWAERGRAVVAALRATAKESQADTAAALEAQGVRYRSFWVDNSMYVEAGSRRTALRAAADPAVASIRPAGSVPLEQPRETSATTKAAGVEWGVAHIKADQVWERYGDRGQGVVVASIDSGVQFDHPALAASYRGNRGDGSFDHDYSWWDPSQVCGSPSLAPCDNVGHGTHTMGTMVGDGGPGNRVGVAPRATWIAAKGCETDGCSDLALVSSAQWLLAPTDLAGENPDPSKRPHIINNSWGGPGGGDWYRSFVRAWVAAGIFPAFSSGNDGPDCDTAGTPGDYAEAYSVGNYTPDGTIAASSGRGPGLSGDTKPDIAAPGTNVRSSVPGNRYDVLSGTSMASPHLAGTIALMWSASPALVGDVEATRQLLDDTARDKADFQCGGGTDDNNVYGEGQLDALAAVSAAPRGATGTLRGSVREQGSGDPVARARVLLEGASTRSVTTREDGSFTIKLAVGRYALTVRKFGFDDAARAGIEILEGASTATAVELTRSPVATLTGSVQGASGHRWPLYAHVVVDGTPVSTYTDPATGEFALDLPVGQAYQLRTAAEYPGYVPRQQQVRVDSDTTVDLRLQVDADTCTAPGYRRGSGLRETFDGTSPPAGWAVVDNAGTGEVWAFDDPGRRGNLTGGQGGFGTVDSDAYGPSGFQDTALVSPPVDLSDATAPVLEFASDLKLYWFDRADVDVSTDGGGTWTNVWRRSADDVRGPGTIRVPLPSAANQDSVRVRFRYHRAMHAWWWQIDDVYLGEATCLPEPGGLLVGHTRRSLTGTPVDGTHVSSPDAPTEVATSAATPADDQIPDGFYWLFTSLTGKHRFAATADEHGDRSVQLTVPEGQVVEQDFGLPTGRVAASGPVSATVEIGRRTTRRLTLVNTGDGEVHYELQERRPGDGPPTEAAPAPDRTGPQRGAPARRVPAQVSPLRTGGSRAQATATRARTSASGGPWTLEAPYPTKIKDSVAGHHGGRLYSFGGSVGDGAPLTASYAYDPAMARWTSVADMPQARQKAAGAFIDRRFVVTGGWGADFRPVAATSIYDPDTDSWSSGAPNPAPWAASGSAVLDGKLYAVGGCAEVCGSTDVLRYDPDRDIWERLADYPEKVAWSSCGGIRGKVFCAGGIGSGSASMATYAYTPETDSWERVADLPADLWASAYSVSGDRLIVAGGAVDRSSEITNEAFAYDAVDDAWTRLPSSHHALYRAAGACGFFKVGGSGGTFHGNPSVEHLPGHADCAQPVALPWLEVNQDGGVVKAGRRRSVKVTLDARHITEPGSYTALLRVAEDTPFPFTEIPVELRVVR